MVGIIFLLVFLISLVFVLIFLGAWTYRDASNRGLNGGLWTAIVILVPNFIGLIIYFLAGRNQSMTKCRECNETIPNGSKYCMNCGSTVSNDYLGMEKDKKSIKGFMIALIISLVVMVTAFIGFGVTLISNNFFDEEIGFDSGFSIGLIETNIGNKWNVSYIKSNEKFYRSIKIKDDSPNILYVESKTKEGKLYLKLIQEDNEVTIDVSDTSGKKSIDLTKFKEGKVKMYLQGEESKNVKFKSYWE